MRRRRNHLREQGAYVHAKIVGSPEAHGLKPREGRPDAFLFEYLGVRVAVGFDRLRGTWSAWGLGDASAIRFGQLGHYPVGVTIPDLVEDIKTRICDTIIEIERVEL